MERIWDGHRLRAVIINCSCNRSANKSNHPIHNPLLLVTQTPHMWQCMFCFCWMSCSWKRKKIKKKVTRNPGFWVKLVWPYFNCYWSVVIRSRWTDAARSSLSGTNFTITSLGSTHGNEHMYGSVDPTHPRHHCALQPQFGVLSWPDPHAEDGRITIAGHDCQD
jgi:hypothetical protein